MDEVTLSEQKVLKRIMALREDIEAIQQPRSDYAIKHFVVGQHVLPGRQRMQAVLELQIKMFNIQQSNLELERLEVEIDAIKHKTFNDRWEEKLADIDIRKKELEIAQLNLSRMGNIREAKALLSIVDQLPKYTYEQYQAEEAEYWDRRIRTQAEQDVMATGRIGTGNQEALRQIGLVPQLQAEN